MENFLKQNWFKLAIVTVAAFGVCYFITLSQKREAIENLNNDIALQAKCADRAASFYKQGGYEKEPKQGFSNSYYISHWNKKLGKCFVQITSISPDGDLTSIDVFDAFEGKHYAFYTGHNFCDPAFLTLAGNPKKCQFDSGSIWFDGNDTRVPADYHVGFQGFAVGPDVGDQNTQKKFLDHIQPFMTE
jgi:hypothetical protein